MQVDMEHSLRNPDEHPSGIEDDPPITIMNNEVTRYEY